MRYDHFSMLPGRAFRPYSKYGMTLEGGGKGGSTVAAPDYTSVANASEASAQIAATQADRVLAESTRQYNRNLEVAQPIIDAQTEIMKSSQQQGNDYYDYWKTKAQPVENALNAEAMATGTPDAQQAKVDRAIADSQGGYTRALDQAFREGRRYGVAPIAATGTMAVQQAANTAGAATAARDKEISMGTAKKLDVAGLYRGIPGVSQGAYGAATAAGNGAAGNSVAVGNGMTNGAIAAGGLAVQGQGQRLQGLGSILGSQTSIYNSANQDSGGGFGAGLGLIGQLGSAWLMRPSDRRLKKDIALVGKTGSGINLYEFAYKDSDGTRYRGVMADEVESVMPEAVEYDDMGFASVNYGMLGIEMEEVAS